MQKQLLSQFCQRFTRYQIPQKSDDLACNKMIESVFEIHCISSAVDFGVLFVLRQEISLYYHTCSTCVVARV